MGRGIAAVIPIVIGPYREDGPTTIDTQYFSKNFFDYYDFHKKERMYTLKFDLFRKNYLDFLTEFYTCIGEKKHLENIPDISNSSFYEKFFKVFERNARNGNVPYIYDGDIFSCVGGQCYKYWLFYSGSYKAFFEEGSTLLHFERLLPKAIKNPLANSVKFGIYG